VDRICTVHSFCAYDVRLETQVSSCYVEFEVLMAMTGLLVYNTV
jgi:hypothetical protein